MRFLSGRPFPSDNSTLLKANSQSFGGRKILVPYYMGKNVLEEIIELIIERKVIFSNTYLYYIIYVQKYYYPI